MAYFARKAFSGSLVHKKNNFGLMWQIVFKLEYLICQRRKDASSEFEWKWWATIILSNFLSKP